MGTVNAGTMNKRYHEVAVFCCLQQQNLLHNIFVVCKRPDGRENIAKEGGYNFFWKGSKDGTAGVGMMVAEKLVK